MRASVKLAPNTRQHWVGLGNGAGGVDGGKREREENKVSSAVKEWYCLCSGKAVWVADHPAKGPVSQIALRLPFKFLSLK